MQHKFLAMGLPINDKKNAKLTGKNAVSGNQNSKFIAKGSKAVGVTKKPIKTGGSRGS